MGSYGGVALVALPVAELTGAPHTLADTGTAPPSHLAHIFAVLTAPDQCVDAAAQKTTTKSLNSASLQNC